MLNILILILGTALAHGRRGGRRCLSEIVDLTTQDADLVTALKPFTEAASEGDAGDAVVLNTASTTCVMRGLPNSWPHEEAEPEILVRRLLHGRRNPKNKVKFDVDAQTFSALSRKNRDDDAPECYDDGRVTFAYSSSEVFPSQTGQRRRLPRGGRGGHGGHGGRHGGNGHHDSSDSDEAEPTPYAVLTFTQTNAIPDADTDAVVEAAFDLTMNCRPWYKLDDVADGETETCTLQGLKCYDGEYTFLTTDDGETEPEENDRTFRSMKCSDAADFADDWAACTATSD